MVDMELREGSRLMTPAEVAVLFRVDARTVGRWEKAGKLTSVRTPGNHRRFREDEVLRLLGQRSWQAANIPAMPAGPGVRGLLGEKPVEHDHVYSSAGRCMWPRCGQKEE